MTGNRFAMVSEWMTNGNINEFVTAHRDVNRFELVSSPFKLPRQPPIADDYLAPVVMRCSEGVDLYARSRNGPWGSQGGASWKPITTPPSLTAST